MKHHVLASAALFAAAFSGLSLDRAHAAQIKDDDNGSYVDDFSDGVGISTFSGTLVNVSSGVVELLAAQPGHFITKDINPTALSAWNKVYLKGTAGFELTILDSSGTVLQAATLVGSDDPNFSQMAIISGVAASNKPIRLKINIAPNGPIWPALDKVKVTWSPEATLLLSAQSPSTLCSGATGLWKFPFSVSNVTARTVVVKVPLTSGQLSPTFADQTPNLQFIGATQGGQYHAGPGPIVVDGVTIDPQTVYWRLGDVRYGSTFPLSFTAVIPNGTLKNTTWNFTATAAAGNAQTVQAAVPTTTADASPGLVLEKTLTGVYRIGNEWRARNGSTIGYRLTARHSYSPTCRATIENAVIWDPLTITTTPSAQAPYAGAPTLITPGLVYTAGGATPYPANGYTTPITVPANSVYAKIDSLPVGASMTWEFTLPLSGALNNDELVTNKAYANITYTPQRQANNLEATASFKIGIDYAPHGLYAKGDSIRGSASISGGQDNVNLSVGYGEYLKFLLFAGNQGASVLKTTTLFDKLPVDKVDFVDAYAPPGVTLYYYDGGTTNAANDPPGYNATTGALTGWTTSPGATVNWVAAKIDRIGSSVITDLNGSAPLSTTVEIGVRVKPPTNGCSNDSITNDGAFHTVSYENGAGTVIATNMAIATNAESVTVVPQVPSFALSWASSNPAIALTSGPIDYTVNLTNLVPGAPGQTDLATNVSVRIDVPRTSIAGVTRAIDVIGVDTFGGTVDTNGLPDFFIVTYPQLAAGASAAIVVHTSVPRGVVDGGQARLSAVINGEDTGAFTCPVSATTVSA
ncbi:MAG: hypothetical protein JNJ59_12680, partial [Deltaproteobacteria bacterium]|nr:hypothetical protein [Deltaproteobacteria bacterium]